MINIKKLGISVSLFDVILILNIVAITFFIWRQLPLVTLRADGYQYLIEILWKKYFIFPKTIINYEQGAVLAGMLLGKIIGVRVELYYWVSLFVLIFLNILIYFLVLRITKRKIVAFAASLIMAGSYFGNWAMYAQGIYAFLQDRVLSLVFIIPAFMFLHQYLESEKQKYLVYSLVLYFLAIALWHWGVIITGLCFFYCVFSRKKAVRNIFIGFLYVAISVLFILLQQISQSGIGPQEWTFTEFVLNPSRFHYPADILRQLVYLSSYPLLFNGLRSFLLGNGFEAISYISDLPNIQKITAPIAILYSLLTVFIYFRLPKMRTFLVTLILSFLSVTLLNCYFGRYIVATQAGANRYLHLPALLFSFYWALAFWAIFWRGKSLILKYLGLFLLGIYLLVNLLLIDNNFKHLFGWDHSANVVITYVRNMDISNLSDTLIVGPYPEFQGYESYFFSQYKRGNNIRFVDNHDVFENDVTWVEIAKSYKHLIMLEYNKSCDCVIRNVVR